MRAESSMPRWQIQVISRIHRTAPATMKRGVRPSEYGGAVEATPMTTLERKPIALRLRPLSGTSIVAGARGRGDAPVAATLSVAISVLVPLLPRIGRRRDKSY